MTFSNFFVVIFLISTQAFASDCLLKDAGTDT